MTNEAADILRKAKELIETKGWIQGTYARDAIGRDVHPASKNAVAFCMYGAFRTIAMGNAFTDSHFQNHELREARDFLNSVIEAPISLWNDEPGRTKEQVLSAFDRAIALAEAK